MKTYFADTFFYLALLSRRDRNHARAVRAAAMLNAPVVTTAWVMTEVANAASAHASRGRFLALWDALVANPSIEIVPADPSLFQRGLGLYRERPDKDWSLTDCISFVVMRERGLGEALTADRHFEQAGFVALLKAP